MKIGISLLMKLYEAFHQVSWSVIYDAVSVNFSTRKFIPGRFQECLLRNTRRSANMSFLKCYDWNVDEFFNNNMTWYEAWISYIPETKLQSKEWYHSKSPNTKLNPAGLTQKTMAIVF